MNISFLHQSRDARLEVIAELLGRANEFPKDYLEAQEDNFQSDIQLIERK